MKVEYIDHMGDDLAVVDAARVSFDKASHWEIIGQGKEKGGVDITASLSDKDTKLIKYLATHNHWTPFAHPQITLREKVPIFVARQRFKHTVGFVYNEVSRRYVDSEPEFFTPDAWRRKAPNVKQGSTSDYVTYFTQDLEDFVPNYKDSITTHYSILIDDAVELYENMLEAGVAPELARMVLPQSLYTEYVVTGSLAAFARAYNLRSQPDAQAEIRFLATEWDKLVRPLFPHSWSALVD